MTTHSELNKERPAGLETVEEMVSRWRDSVPTHKDQARAAMLPREQFLDAKLIAPVTGGRGAWIAKGELYGFWAVVDKGGEYEKKIWVVVECGEAPDFLETGAWIAAYGAFFISKRTRGIKDIDLDLAMMISGDDLACVSEGDEASFKIMGQFTATQDSPHAGRGDKNGYGSVYVRNEGRKLGYGLNKVGAVVPVYEQTYGMVIAGDRFCEDKLTPSYVAWTLLNDQIYVEASVSLKYPYDRILLRHPDIFANESAREMLEAYGRRNGRPVYNGGIVAAAEAVA